MRPIAPSQKSGHETAHKRSILAEIGEMLAYVRRDKFLSTLVMVVSAVNLLFVGPLIVGTATLGRVRFVEGSAAFGVMLSTFSIGALIGTLVSGVVRSKWSGVISLLLLAAQGLFMVGLAQASTLVMACGLLALMGMGAGFGNVTLITLTQKRVARDKLGRFMSLIALAEVGLTPISNALAGVMADLNVTAMYILAGGLLTLISLLAVANPIMCKLDN
jgi:MFS family permease